MSSTTCPQQPNSDLELASLPSMAPDRGSAPHLDHSPHSNKAQFGEDAPDNASQTSYSTDSDTEPDVEDAPDASLLQRDDAQAYLAEQAEQAQNFTVRSVLVGLAIGVLIAFSNAYFGLQTGWISGMVSR